MFSPHANSFFAAFRYFASPVRFAVYSSDAADEQGYRLYDAASMSGSQAFGIGDEIACWESGTGGTILRSAALTGNYDDVRQGSYTGYINYTISLENTQN